MNLDGARNAKAEAFLKAFNFQEFAAAYTVNSGSVFGPALEGEAYRQIEQARRSKKADPRDLISIGILNPSGHNQDPNELLLGIFIQQKRLMDHPIVHQAQRAARGEAKIIYTGPIRRFTANGGRCRPLRIGASVGHFRVSGGTLGCFAKKRSSGGIGILSNNHVLADTNRGKAGDLILQPAKVHGGRHNNIADQVAMLDKVVPLKFEVNAINEVDCAFAYMLDGIEYDAPTVSFATNPAIRWTIRTNIEDVVVPTLPVKKLAAETGVTQGVVEATEIDNLHVAYRFGGSSKIARFDRQIGIVGVNSAFSKPGDSGALILTEENRAMGLLFAGSERGSRDGRSITFANPIGTVLDALEVDIYTGA